jgi:hypothetical protein
MAITPKCIIEPVQLTNANVNYYAVTKGNTIIDKLTLCNTTTSSANVTIDLVESGGSAGVSKRILSARTISPGETYNCVEASGHVLNIGDSIQAFASVSARITIRASGREVAL